MRDEWAGIINFKLDRFYEDMSKFKEKKINKK
jgi:hypothetical protein